MRISAFCLRKVGEPKNQRGMTLLELIVVLFIAAIVTGVALPYTVTSIHTNQVHAATSAIQDALNSLSLRAYSEGRTLVLNAKTIPDLVPGVPTDWRLEVPKPIVFDLNGLCAPGKVVLHTDSKNATTWVITPPACRFAPSQ